jgi:pilus assembly protein CpaE
MSKQLTFVISGTEPDTLAGISSALDASGRARIVSDLHEPAEMHAEIVRHLPSTAIIVLSDPPEPELALIKQIAAELPGTMLIGASANASTDLILSSLRAGAHEFLRLPIHPDELHAILQRAAEHASRHTIAAPTKRGRVVAVFSNKGGCGTSFVASNLAVSLGVPTVLMDLNLQSGNLGFFFHLEPKFSITDLIQHQTRMDDELLASLLTPYSPRLSLLPAPADVDAAVDVTSANVLETLELLRRRYEYVVLDLAHTFDEITLAALDQADDILLVFTLDIMTVRNSLRVLATLERLGYPSEKIHAVVNRWSKNDVELGRPQIERLFGNRSVYLVPNDYKVAVNSINLGQPLVESRPTSAISIEIKRLAVALGGAAGEKAKSKAGAKLSKRDALELAKLDRIPGGNGHDKAETNGHKKPESERSPAQAPEKRNKQFLSLFFRRS